MSSGRFTRSKVVPEGATVVKFGGTKSRPLKTLVVEQPKAPGAGRRVQQVRLNVAGRKTRPPYLKMVKLAIASNKAHWLHGTSYAAIANYILENYPTNAQNFRRLLRVTLARAVSNNQIEKTGNRYKFTKAEWEKDKAAAARAQAREKKANAAARPARGTASRPAKKRTTATASAASSRAAPAAKKAAPVKKRAPPTQRKTTAGRTAATQAAPAQKQTQAQGGLKWFWQYFDNGWFNYDPTASDVVEANYQDYLKNPGHSDVRAVHSGHWNYMVDFRQMMQQNVQHENHTRRKIRRVQLPVNEINNRAQYAENHFDQGTSDSDDDSMDE